MGTLVLKSDPLRLYNVYLAAYAGDDVYLGELARTSDDDSDLVPKLPDDIRHEGRLAMALGRFHASITREPERVETFVVLINGRIRQDRIDLALYCPQPETAATEPPPADAAEPRIVFEWDGRRWSAPMSFYTDAAVVEMPTGFLAATGWLESMPPQPRGLTPVTPGLNDTIVDATPAD